MVIKKLISFNNKCGWQLFSSRVAFAAQRNPLTFDSFLPVALFLFRHKQCLSDITTEINTLLTIETSTIHMYVYYESELLLIANGLWNICCNKSITN